MISSPVLTTSAGAATRDHAISETCSSPCTPPPKSTNAPKSRTDATRPVSTAPTTIVRLTSAALACCSSSSRARRETTRFLPPSPYSMMRNSDTCPSSADGSAPGVPICENGQKARWPPTRTSNPPLTARSILPSTGSLDR